MPQSDALAFRHGGLCRPTSQVGMEGSLFISPAAAPAPPHASWPLQLPLLSSLSSPFASVTTLTGQL